MKNEIEERRLQQFIDEVNAFPKACDDLYNNATSIIIMADFEGKLPTLNEHNILEWIKAFSDEHNWKKEMRFRSGIPKYDREDVAKALDQAMTQALRIKERSKGLAGELPAEFVKVRPMIKAVIKINQLFNDYYAHRAPAKVTMDDLHASKGNN